MLPTLPSKPSALPLFRPVHPMLAVVRPLLIVSRMPHLRWKWYCKVMFEKQRRLWGLYKRQRCFARSEWTSLHLDLVLSITGHPCSVPDWLWQGMLRDVLGT